MRAKEALSGLDAEKAKISEIKYRLQTAKQQFEELKAALGAAKANLELQEANMRQADADLKRAGNLLKEDIIPKRKIREDKNRIRCYICAGKGCRGRTQPDAGTPRNAEGIYQADRVFHRAAKALAKQKEASLGTAELNLSYTKVIAPADGYITKEVSRIRQLYSGRTAFDGCFAA